MAKVTYIGYTGDGTPRDITIEHDGLTMDQFLAQMGLQVNGLTIRVTAPGRASATVPPSEAASFRLKDGQTIRVMPKNQEAAGT